MRSYSLDECACITGHLSIRKGIKQRNDKIHADGKPGKDARICTNVLDINWTLADYYYPGIAHSYYDTPTAIEADEKTFWLIWRDKLSDDSLLELSQRGLNAEEVYEGRFPNTIYCYVYRVVR